MLRKIFWNCPTWCPMLMLLTYDKMQKCRKLPRQAQITQTNSVHDWWKINMRPSKYALNILWSLQIRAKYNENVMNRLSTINSSVCSVKYRRLGAKIQKNRINDCWMVVGHLDWHRSNWLYVRKVCMADINGIGYGLIILFD